MPVPLEIEKSKANQLLKAMANGDCKVAGKLLPLVYGELRGWPAHTCGILAHSVAHFVWNRSSFQARRSVEGKSRLQCAGINRHEAGNARVLRERSSEPLGPEFCVAHREVCCEA
jgi:hypothetical protein